MTHIEKIDFTLLDDKVKQTLIPETLDSEDLQSDDYIFLLADKDQALLVAEIDPAFKTLSILSVETTDPKWIPPLFQAVEALCLNSDLPLLIITYSSDHTRLTALEQYLKSHDWQGPRRQKIYCHFDAYAFRPPWYDRLPPLPQGYEQFPWNQLKPKEKLRILRLIDQMAIPSDVSPFTDEESIFNANSLGLKYRGEVIGWMVTHLLQNQEVQYSSFYIDKAHRNTAVAPTLLRNSIQLQKESPYQWSVCEVNLLVTDESWTRFVERRLAPYTLRVHYNYQMWKTLRS